MKLITGISFMAFITSISMLDGFYQDAAFNVMMFSAAVLIGMGFAWERRRVHG